MQIRLSPHRGNLLIYMRLSKLQLYGWIGASEYIGPSRVLSI